MSASQDEDERKRRSLEAGRELLEKYKAKRSSKDKNTSVEQSDDESLHNDKSMLQKESGTNEGISSRDITHSSVSVSEGEADGDLDGLAGRVAELEELLQGKETIVGALNAEIDHLRAEASSPNSSQSHGSSVHGRDVIPLYHIKLQEFEIAVNQRDNLIEHLTSSLEQALSARDNVTAQLNVLNSVQLNSPLINNVNLQQKIEVLETTMSDQKALICRLNAQLTDIRKHVQTLEMERETRNAEINDYKTQIDNLNEQIRLGAADRNLNIDETLEQQRQYEARVDKIKQDMQHILNKFTIVTNANATRHQQELKDLALKNEVEVTSIKAKHEECMKVLKDENKMLADRLNKELPDLESRHAKELSVFQTQLACYKETVETLKVELTNHAESQKIAQSEAQLYKSELDETRLDAENERRIQNLHSQREKELLNEQIKLHKVQLEELTSKHVATSSILESKESIERSLEQALTNAASLRQENDVLKFKLDDLSYRYSMAPSIVENNQLFERSGISSIGRARELERSSSRFDGTSMSTSNSELGETMYRTFDEQVVQHQMMRRKLDEKTELDELLIEKIRTVEEDLLKAKSKLEESDLAKKTYEKQLKDMKNTCDKLQQEINSLQEPGCAAPCDLSGEYAENAPANSEDYSTAATAQRLEGQQREIESLKLLMEQKETENASYKKDLMEMTEKARKLETSCNQLRDGLAQAWAQCAEFEDKLNHTLEMSDSSKVNASFAYLNSASSSKHLKTNQSLVENLSDSQNVPDYQKVVQSDNDDASTLMDNSHLKNDDENLYKELHQILTGESSLDEVKLKLRRYYSLCEKMAIEKTRALIDDAAVDKQRDGEEDELLQKFLDNLRMEKELLSQEIENTVNQRREELESVKVDSAKEISRLRLLLQNLKDGDANLNELKTELEARHAKEMEELRTYFERKCLQMEKQYSEEVFSQQSKRISDNDSETEELTDDLYFGGAGDCLNVSNSPAATPGTTEESPKNKISNVENRVCLESEYESSIQALRQELEHKTSEVQSIKTDYKKTIEEKELYEYQLRDVETKLKRTLSLPTMHQYCQTEWEALENGELSSLRDAYNHQLEEQIALARQDIVNALQEKFQALLSVEADKEDSWPAELLELRDRFTSNAKQEIQELKKMHNAELARLKDEHDCAIARMLEHQKEIASVKANAPNTDNNQEIDYIATSEYSIAEERDNLRRTCMTLRNLIGELVNYFAVCEEEVNNTLINEVLKRQSIESIFSNKENLSKNDNAVLAETRHKDASGQSIKRVHFAPQSSKIISIVNSDNKTLQSLLDEDVDEILKKELKACLKRLKSDSNEILTFSSSEDKDTPSSKEILLANKINEELSLKVNHAETLIMGYQEEAEQLKLHIMELQRKLISTERKKEVVTEGYGESDLSRGDNGLQDLLQVQEKARHVLSNGGGDTSCLLQLIEELCRQNDRLLDDARKEKEDLQQQVPLEPTPTPYIHRVCRKKIEAADKKLRATCRFLDDQASEREMEREETTKQIRFLQEHLKEREREKERDMRISSESELSSETTDIPELQSTDINMAVEALESQMREMSSMMSDTDAKRSEKESELKAAVDKIRLLRDIITDLEQQLQTKIEREEFLQLQIGQLETVIIAQTKNQQELVQELDAIKSGSESRHLNDRIDNLQEELSKHKLSSEHFNVNSSVLKQMKSELHEMQNQLDKRIREMESAHMCGSNLSLSQPSEDVSIREQIDATRCLTPDDPSAPPMLPMNQVLKLKDKMLKHSRAEDVAFKRIKDLEMQLATMKNQNEELLAEQEILHQTASEQLFQIEAMRGRLEQHKQSAPFAQKQATSRLELQLHEASAKYHSLEQIITNREMELQELRDHLERANQLLTEKETEMENLMQCEDDALQELKDQLKLVQDQLKLVQEEKKTLQTKLGTQEHTQQELPLLIDTILADKNEEIDHLKEQLSKKEKQLNVYSSLALDDTQLKELTKQAEAKNSARTLSDILSIHSECEEPPEAIRAVNVTHVTSHNVSSFKIPASRNTLNTNSFNPMEASLPDVEKMSAQVPPLDLDFRTHSFSNDVRHMGTDMQHTEGESKLSSSKNSEDSQQVEELLNEKLKEIENLSNQLQTVQQELETKSDLLNKYEVELSSLQKQFQNLQDEFKETIESLVRDKNFYKGQYELTQASESKIKKDLEEVENILKLKADELEEHKDRMQVNERIITELNMENMKLRKEVEIKEKDQTTRHNFLQEKTKELQTLKELNMQKEIAVETLKTRNIEIENENKQLYDFRTTVYAREREIVELQDEILRLTDGLNNRDQIICKLEEMARRTSDAQSDVSSQSNPSNKDEEMQHLQEFLKEKDKVIRQMSDDSKSLQRALETIQNKMKESGNIVELRRKLKEERRCNTELRDMVQMLQRELEQTEASTQQDDSDIEDMVQRELNLSARLDQQILEVIKDDTKQAVGEVPEDHQRSSNDIQDKETLKRLKDNLEIEQDIMKLQIAEYAERILQLTAELTEETKKVATLDKELTSEKKATKFLRLQIDEHRRLTELEQVQGTEIIEFLQTTLRTSLQNEEKLRNDLALMRQQQISLEAQLTSMRKLIEAENTSRNLQMLAATTHDGPERAIENPEESRENNAELRANIWRLEAEMSKYEKRLEIATEEREMFVKSVALVNGQKDALEANLRRIMDELKAQEEKCNYLQKQLRILNDVEGKKQEQRDVELHEMKGLRREINVAREAKIDLETDMKLAKQELKDSLDRELKLSRMVESLKEREAELCSRLAFSKENQRKLNSLIEELKPNSKLFATETEEDARNKLPGTTDVPASFVQKIKGLNEMIEKYAAERNNLQDKLSRMRTDKGLLTQRVKLLEGEVKKLQASSQRTVSMEKLQTFYGKYLRADSRRKSLAYQKKYLLCVVGSYQCVENSTLYMLAQLTETERSHTRPSRNKRVRLRIVILAIISIHRMKWLILRWRTGKRVGANAIMGGIDQLFDLSPAKTAASNHSPPVRERATHASGGRSSFMVEQYYQQVKNFQEAVDLAMIESGTSHVITE